VSALYGLNASAYSQSYMKAVSMKGDADRAEQVKQTIFSKLGAGEIEDAVDLLSEAISALEEKISATENAVKDELSKRRTELDTAISLLKKRVERIAHLPTTEESMMISNLSMGTSTLFTKLSAGRLYEAMAVAVSIENTYARLEASIARKEKAEVENYILPDIRQKVSAIEENFGRLSELVPWVEKNMFVSQQVRNTVGDDIADTVEDRMYRQFSKQEATRLKERLAEYEVDKKDAVALRDVIVPAKLNLGDYSGIIALYDNRKLALATLAGRIELDVKKAWDIITKAYNIAQNKIDDMREALESASEAVETAKAEGRKYDAEKYNSLISEAELIEQEMPDTVAYNKEYLDLAARALYVRRGLDEVKASIGEPTYKEDEEDKVPGRDRQPEFPVWVLVLFAIVACAVGVFVLRKRLPVRLPLGKGKEVEEEELKVEEV